MRASGGSRLKKRIMSAHMKEADLIEALAKIHGTRPFETDAEAVSCGGANLLVSTDSFSEREDFLGGMEPEAMGRAMAYGAIADILACGAMPSFLVQAWNVDEQHDAAFYVRAARGVQQVASRYGAKIVGGDIGVAKEWCWTATVFASIAVAGFLMSPWTLAFLALGGVLNVAYSFLKRVPVLNCFVYACAISCCALFAIAGCLNECPDIRAVLYVVTMVLPVHFLMCHNSYYKDVAGDRIAGVRTLQTMFPGVVAKALSALLSALGVAASWLLAYGMDSWVCESWVRFLQPIAILALVVAFFYALAGRRHHAATCLNCQLCVALLHVLWFDVTWKFELASLVAIQLLFLWYSDEKE